MKPCCPWVSKHFLAQNTDDFWTCVDVYLNNQYIFVVNVVPLFVFLITPFMFAVYNYS